MYANPMRGSMNVITTVADRLENTPLWGLLLEVNIGFISNSRWKELIKNISRNDAVILQKVIFRKVHRWKEIVSTESPERKLLVIITLDCRNALRLSSAALKRSQLLSSELMIVLILTDCPMTKWGTDCVQDCPDCYNGGLCDDKTGQCICRPGFRGDDCNIGMYTYS